MTFKAVENMDNRGKVINMAFAVSASFALGDHLAYTASVSAEMILPMILGKLSAGFAALGVAILLTKRTKAEPKISV